MSLEGKVAVITGASRGIGKATALAMAAHGVDVVVAARTDTPSGQWPGTIHETATEVNALGRRALAIKTDVTREEDVHSMVEAAWAEFGRIDILVNNAGVLGDHRAFGDITPEYWDRILNVNLRGVFLCSKAVVPKMIASGGGSIINVSSAASIRTGFLSLPYGVSKAALDRFTMGLSKELEAHNIAVVSFHAPFAVTPGTEAIYDEQGLSWAQTPESAAEAIVSISEHNPIEITGQALSQRHLVERGIIPRNP